MRTKISLYIFYIFFIYYIFLIISHTKCQNYIFKNAHISFYFCPSLKSILQFHSYTKILTLIALIPTRILCIPSLIHRIPRVATLILIFSTVIAHISTLISLIPFPDSPFWLLQIAL